ncbi:MAG: alpha/beta fold hydrolase [Paracoccaceae bacterium]
MEISLVELGRKDAPAVVFAHGWARTHADFLPIAELIAHQARVILLDLPGFGDSPRPEGSWGTQEYAKEIKTYLADTLGIDNFIWVGHSFGGRIGLRLAAMLDSPVQELIIVAGAGVKEPVPFVKKLKSKWKSRQFQKLKKAAHTDAEIADLESRFGSPDYIQSRELGLRDIFIETIKENQTETARSISCPTNLIYGAHDTETPPAVGRMLNALIPGSKYLECPEFDHHTILTRGRHQVATLLKETLSGDAS